MKFIDAIFSGSIFISGSFTPPKGTKDQRPTNPVTASVFFETSDSGSRLLIYNGSGSDGWQEVGLQSDPVPPPPPIASADIEYLVVAGGGGGGGGGWGAGGGGAGGMLSSSISSVESGSIFTINVGAGGAGRGGGNTFTAGGNGVTSSIAGATITTIEATGGGGGGAENDNSGLGRDGGSGGGSTQQNASGGSGTAGQGNDGGTGGTITSPGYPGAGGGGKGSVGSNASGNNGGNGGTGQASSITGTSLFYAAGGGGGTRTSGAQGSGGSSIGGDGANDATAATSATINRGAGGGGAAGNSNANASNGSSGVVILAYDSGSINAVGGLTGDAGNGRKYHQFNTTGTFKVGSSSDFGIVTSSLVLHLDAGDYNSRGASTWTDLTGNGYNGTPTNGPTLGNNFYYTLDGSNDTIRFTENSNMINTSTMSIEMWLAVGNLGSNYSQFITNRSSTGGDYSTTMAFGVDNRQVVRTWNPSGTDTMVVAAHIGNSAGNASYYAWSNNMFGTSDGDGNFHHVVMTFSSGTLKLYYDGSLVNTNSSGPTTLWAGDEYYRIGGEYSVGDYTYNLPADIGQVRFYHKELSAAEVLQNYNATKTNFV